MYSIGVAKRGSMSETTPFDVGVRPASAAPKCIGACAVPYVWRASAAKATAITTTRFFATTATNMTMDPQSARAGNACNVSMASNDTTSTGSPNSRFNEPVTYGIANMTPNRNSIGVQVTTTNAAKRPRSRPRFPIGRESSTSTTRSRSSRTRVSNPNAMIANRNIVMTFSPTRDIRKRGLR